MAKRGRKKGSKSDGSYPKVSIGIAWAKAKDPEGKVKVKVVKNYNIDEIMDLNYNLPGIDEDAVIKAVVMGKTLCENLKARYL